MNPPKQPAPKKPLRLMLRRKAVLVAIGCVLGLGLCEVGLRVLGVSYPQPYGPDPRLGTRLQPGFSGWFTREGRAFVTVNSDGFRDRHHEIDAVPNAYRIVVLGDSYAEAVQVELNKTFWSVLEAELSIPGRDVEVLNFGIAGYGTAQEFEALRHVAINYKPDLVIMAFLSGNDIRNNSRELEPSKARPFYQMVNHELVLDESFRQHPDYLKAQSKATQFKVNLINRSRILQAVMEWRNRRGRDAAGEAGLDAEVYREPADARWRDAWVTTERLIGRASEFSKSHGAEFALVTLTNGVQVHPDPTERRRFAEALNVPDLLYPERRLRSFGETSGIPVITLAEEFARRAEEDGTWFHGFPNTTRGKGHWNEDGHDLAGRIIAREVSKLIGARDSKGSDESR